MPRLDFYRSSDAKPILSVRLDLADLLIGRAPECTVQLPGSKLSRHHLRIRASDGGHLLWTSRATARGSTPLGSAARYASSRATVSTSATASSSTSPTTHRSPSCAEPTLVDSQIPG